MGIEQDLAAIERRRRLAEVMMQQGAEDIPMQTAGGMVVPVSPLQGISKIANMLSGAYIGNKADREGAAIKQARMDALGNIDFNSPEAASELAKAGFVSEAVKMRMSKAEKAQENRYQPTNMVVTDPKTGVKYLRRFGSLPGNEVTDTSPIPSDVQWLDTGSEFKPVPKQGVIPGQPGGAPSLEKPRYKTNNEIIDAVIEAESNGNHSAVSPKGATGLMQLMPETAKNPGFGIEPVRDNSPQENIRVGSEYLKELAKKYGGDQQKAFAAYNWGTGNVDNALSQYGNDWMNHTPKETQDYVAKLDKMLGGGVIRKQLTPAQEKQYSPIVAGDIKRAETEAQIPGKVEEERQKSQIKVGEVQQTERIKNDAELDKDRKKNEAERLRNAEKTGDTLTEGLRYLYPEGEGGQLDIKRDKNGRLIPPEKSMIYGASPADRIQSKVFEWTNSNDPKAANLRGVQRAGKQLALQALGGKLGTGVSNADVEFIQRSQGILESAQNINDVYNAYADIEQRVNSIKNKSKPKAKFMGFE